MARAIKKAIAKIRMVNLDSLVWSDAEYEVEEFLEEFRLPQIVMVQEGVYERTNEKTVSAGQVLKLHTVQQSEKVFGETSKGEEICIPLRCPHKLEIVPDSCNNVEHETFEELFNLSPKYVRALDTLERPQIKKGTIFELKGKTLLSRIWYVELKNTAKPYNRVQIPLLMKARFQPLVDWRSYFLVEALKIYSFPFQVRFLKTTEAVDRCQDDFMTEEDSLDLPSLGVITLQDRKKESTVISTSRNGRTVTVVTFPTDLSISFSPALGLLKAESTYARICRDFHDGVDLEKIKNRGQQKAYLSKNAVQQVDLDYEEIPPIVPPRDVSPQPEIDGGSDEWSDSEDEELEIEDSPPKVVTNTEQTQSCLDITNNNSNTLSPPRLPKPLKAMPSSRLTTNPRTDLKKPPPIKPKPNLNKKKDVASPFYRETASIEQKKNIEGPYNRAYDYEPNSPACSQDKAVCEDSGIGMEVAPIPPVRDSSLHHEQEGREEQEEQNYWSSEGEGAVASVGDDDEYSGKNGSRDSKHDYIYIDHESQMGLSKPKMMHPNSPPPLSRLMQVFRRLSGANQHSNSLTSLEDLRRVVDEDLLQSLTINQVADCLKLLHLSEYRKEFKKRQIDGSLFASLTEQHLVDLGVQNVTDRTKILKLVREGWVPKL